MKKIYLVRHAQAVGNDEKKFIGCRSDVPLTIQGINFLPFGLFRDVRWWAVSPMLRCLQTAAVLAGVDTVVKFRPGGKQPRAEKNVVKDAGSDGTEEEINELLQRLLNGRTVLAEPDLRECDFGIWEGKNYKMLNGDPLYQEWIDSGGTLPFPEGESPEHFAGRCRSAFFRLSQRFLESPEDTGVMVVHGGTIMSVLSGFGVDEKRERYGFYDYQAENGAICVLEMEHMGDEMPWCRVYPYAQPEVK